MIVLTAILAWLPMPMDAITSDYADDWYAPVQTIYLDHEPTLEELEKDLKRRGIRIMDAQGRGE